MSPDNKKPHDQAARDRIEHDLDTNLLVEAGAGSGKTEGSAPFSARELGIVQEAWRAV